MPAFRIPPEEADVLARQPETAMGYQLLELSLQGWNQRHMFLALDSRYLFPANSLEELFGALQVLLGTTAEQLDELPGIKNERVKDIGLPSRDGITIISSWGPRVRASLLDPVLGVDDRLSAVVQPQPLSAAIVTVGLRAYFRFSAFPNDRRVLPDGSYKSGTYATTANDLRMVPSGFAAMARYAIPNPMSAKYVYPLITSQSPSRVGATVPNFEQSGGGVEVLFSQHAQAIHGQAWDIPDE
jgi:hypothetical protein